MAKKVIAIVGATGAQGGALVRAILAQGPEGEFEARALTRNPESEKSKELIAQGATVVKADVDDEASLVTAFEGAYGVFCVTFFWDHFSPKQELQQATNMANAAKTAGVKHVVWSTLEDTRAHMDLSDDRMPTLMEHYKVPHFDSKGEADAIFNNLGLPVTHMRTSFYLENFTNFTTPQRQDGTLSLAFPMDDKPLPVIATADIGRCALGIFSKPEEYIGRTVGIAGDILPVATICEKMSAAIGETVTYNAVPADVYRSFGFPGCEDLGNMFQFKRDFNDVFCSNRSIEESRKLSPELQSVEQWFAENKGKIPIP